MPKSSKKTQRSKLPKTGVQASSRRNAPRRGRKRGNARGSMKGTSMSGGRLPRSAGKGIFSNVANFKSNSTSLPAAFVTLQDNSTFIMAPKKVTHPFLGVDGIALVGCQPLSTIGMTNTASDPSVFTTATLATVTNDNNAFPAVIRLSPDDLNGPLAAQANLHGQFVFRDIIIEYVSNCATSQADSMVIGYVGESVVSVMPTTFSQLRQVVPSCTFPFRSDRAYLHYHYSGMNTYYTAADTANSAGIRLTHQGSIVAYADKNQGNVASLGYTNIFYNIELYFPTSSQGVSLVAVKSDDEKKIAKDAVDLFRKAKLEGLEMPRLKPCERFGAKCFIDCDSKEEWYRRQSSLFDDRKFPIATGSSLGTVAADTASLIGDDYKTKAPALTQKVPQERDRDEIIADYVKLRSLSKDRKVDVPKGPPDKPNDKSLAK